MYVFNLLAQREGKAHKTTRSGSVDFGSIALATKEAAKEAEREVGAVILTCGGPGQGHFADWLDRNQRSHHRRNVLLESNHEANRMGPAQCVDELFF